MKWLLHNLLAAEKVPAAAQWRPTHYHKPGTRRYRTTFR